MSTLQNVPAPPQLPVGRRPITPSFQCVAVDLVEYKFISDGDWYILSVIDHLTRFVIWIAIRNKGATTIVRNFIERVFAVPGAPETLHSDQCLEFEHQLGKELHDVLGYKKTRIAPYRPQVNLVLERVHSTVRNMVAMYSTLSCCNMLKLLLFVKLAHNTA